MRIFTDEKQQLSQNYSKNNIYMAALRVHALITLTSEVFYLSKHVVINVIHWYRDKQ